MKAIVTLLFGILLFSCANRKTTEQSAPQKTQEKTTVEQEPKADTAAIVAEEQKVPEEEVSMDFEEGFWMQSSLSDLPDLEYAVDPNQVESVWYLKTDDFLKMIKGEAVPFQIPTMSGLEAFNRSNINESSAQANSQSSDCQVQISWSNSTPTFDLGCDYQTFQLVPALKGNRFFYALVNPDK